VIDARIGDFVVVARQERGGADWYLGAITDEDARTLEVPLTFLPPGRRFVAEIYADGAGADWLRNPLPVSISKRTVTSASRLRVALARGGGQAIRLRAVR
jgi:alpha-glucosidase